MAYNLGAKAGDVMRGIGGPLGAIARRLTAAVTGGARPAVAILVATVVVMGAATAALADVEYDYTGTDFTNFFPFAGPYTTSDKVTGDIVLSNSLAPSSVNTLTSLNDFSSFSFADGVISINKATVEASTATDLEFGGTITTNAADQIVSASLTFQAGTTGPNSHSETISIRPDTGSSGSNSLPGISGSGQSFTPGAWSGPVGTSTSACSTDIQSASFVPVASGPTMTASFTVNGGLLRAEKDCNVTAFNWKQMFDVLPSPSPYFPSSNPTTAATAPPSFIDPVPGGWDTTPHTITCNGRTIEIADGNGDDSNPFYFSAAELAAETNTDTLSFFDRPTDVCLSGQNWTGLTTSGLFIEFTTELVGMNGTTLVDLPVTDTWDWVTTYDGTSGEAARLKNLMSVDPGSGTGETAILSVNGVPVPEPSTMSILVIVILLLYKKRSKTRYNRM